VKVFVEVEGKQHVIETTSELPLMEVMRDAGLPVLASCGGSCACATCHVYVDPAWVDRLQPKSADEEATLDGAFGIEYNSRLSCQIPMSPDLDGLKVILAPDAIG
jgi:ferredoxin, 2Fe-2S